MSDAPARPRHETADICIIGAGAAGLVAASGAAQLGFKVVLFEKGRMGGDCLNYGCVPSKSLIAAANAAQNGRGAQRFGVRFPPPEIAWSDVAAHIHATIAGIAPVDSQERFESLGVIVVREAARFIDARTVASASVVVRARKVLIATGAHPFVPPISGVESTPYLTNETIFDLEELPQHLLVLGGGAIGLELAQAFRRLGSDVSIVEAGKVMAGGDSEAVAVLAAQLRAEGIAIHENAQVVRTAPGREGGVDLWLASPGGEQRLSGSHLLIAAGRKPTIADLGLDVAGISFSARGIQTDGFLRTTNRRVWAAGDVAGREQFTHTAGLHGALFVRNALFRVSPASADAAAMPRVVYTDPELAQVGLSEEGAQQRYGGRARVLRASFEDNDRARAERASEGFVKIVVAPGGRVVGATIVGEGAGDMIASLQLSIANKLKVAALTTPFVPAYPTRTETVKRAAGQYFATALFSPVTRALVTLTSRLP